MKRVKKICLSVVIAMACVSSLMAQDSLWKSALSCSIASHGGCVSHCPVHPCSCHIKPGLRRVEGSRLALASYKSGNLCICKLMRLSSSPSYSSMRSVSAANIGYHLNALTFPSGVSTQGNSFIKKKNCSP